jgi:hypothetical protein
MPSYVWDLVDPTELVNYVRTYDNEVLSQEANFVLDGYLPNVLTDELDFRVRKGSLQDVDAGVFRAWDTPAPLTDRPGTARISGELGPVSRQIQLSEEEHLRLRALERGTDDPIIDAIYADSERMIRSVQARIEIARGDLIDDGKLTIAENGLVMEADWGRSATASPTAAIEWDLPATATPLSDLLGWLEDYDDLNGTLPANTVISRQTFGFLALNAELRDYNASGGTTPTRLTSAAINGTLAAEGIPPFLIYDGQFRVNGTRTRVLNQNKAYFMPPSTEALGETRYGITAEAMVLRERGLIDAESMPGVVAVVTANDHPTQTFTVGAAVALPIMPNPDLVFDCLINT